VLNVPLVALGMLVLGVAMVAPEGAWGGLWLVLLAIAALVFEARWVDVRGGTLVARSLVGHTTMRLADVAIGLRATGQGVVVYLTDGSSTVELATSRFGLARAESIRARCARGLGLGLGSATARAVVAEDRAAMQHALDAVATARRAPLDRATLWALALLFGAVALAVGLAWATRAP
jgi:hypothetical protein